MNPYDIQSARKNAPSARFKRVVGPEGYLEVEFPRGWLQRQCARVEAEATLIPRLKARVEELEDEVAALKAKGDKA